MARTAAAVAFESTSAGPSSSRGSGARSLTAAPILVRQNASAAPRIRRVGDGQNRTMAAAKADRSSGRRAGSLNREAVSWRRAAAVASRCVVSSLNSARRREARVAGAEGEGEPRPAGGGQVEEVELGRSSPPTLAVAVRTLERRPSTGSTADLLGAPWVTSRGVSDSAVARGVRNAELVVSRSSSIVTALVIQQSKSR